VQPARDRLRHIRFEIHLRIANFAMQDAAEAVHERQRSAIGQRDGKAQTQNGIDRHGFIDAPQKVIESGVLERRDVDVSVGARESREIVRRQTVDLVEDVNARAVLDTKIAQHFFHFGILFGVLRIGNIADVQKERGLLHFLERGAKSSQQALGQIANESDGVGKKSAKHRRG
jgi:hypothetical protein